MIRSFSISRQGGERDTKEVTDILNSFRKYGGYLGIEQQPLKLSPAQLLILHEHVITQRDQGADKNFNEMVAQLERQLMFVTHLQIEVKRCN